MRNMKIFGKGGRGGREREPGPPRQEPTVRNAPDLGAPRVEDPYRSIVDYHTHGSNDLSQVRVSLGQQYNDPTVVDQLMERVTKGREERAKRE